MLYPERKNALKIYSVVFGLFFLIFFFCYMAKMNNLKASTLWIQFVAALIMSFQAMLTGFVTAWPSYTVEKFKSSETVLSRPMTSMDVSLLGCLVNLGGFIGSPIFGYACNKFGRKYSTFLFSVPFVISWIIITLTKNIPTILIAVTIAGIAVAGQKLSIIFMSEISHDSIRGGLTSCTAMGYYVGILISHILGGYLSYYHMLYTLIAMNALTVLSLLLLKESPMYLILVGKEDEAAKSIAFYNQVEVTSKLVESEIKKIKLQLETKVEKATIGNKDAEALNGLIDNSLSTSKTANAPQWKILLESKSSKRVLTRMLTIIMLIVFMGNSTMQVFGEPLFKEAVPSMSANTCAIILAVNLTLACALCVLVIDKCGRKSLLIATSALSGMCCLLLGLQLQWHLAPHWVTALLIYSYSFVYTLGPGTVAFVLMSEVFLPEVRDFCGSVTIAAVWISNFITLFIFFPMIEAFGLGIVFYGFSSVCFLGAIYTYFKLPETKGLSADAIQELFLKLD